MRWKHVIVVSCFGLVLPAALAAQDPEPHPHEVSVAAVRNAGTLLMSWVIANTTATEESTEEAATTEYRWSSCPPISYEDVRELLDVRRADQFPSTDGWGNDLEYCLRSEDLGATGHVVGVRSPGRDGDFDSDTYQLGSFATAETDRDTVWMDGVFVAWPAIEELRSLDPGGP